MARIINVSNRLPVTVGERIERSSGGLVAALEGLSGREMTWIGWPGAAIDDDAQREQVRRTLESEFNCVGVFLSDKIVKGFYEGFANASLWPLLHSMPSRFTYEPSWWDDYRDANHAFAEAVAAIAQADDVIWVHDYQLMLLPSLLRARLPSARIGFFLHTPFPSYEIFRCHPRRAELIQGLLGADQIGFHTFGYLRHFRSSVLRLLGIEPDMMHVRQADRATRLGVYPIGIDAARFETELGGEAFRHQLRETRAAHAGRHVVLSVERLDYTKGLPQRLDAIDLFLSRAKDREKVQFIIISVPSREGVAEYQQLREEVESRIGRLNGKYSTVHNTPVRFVHGSVTFTELCALYAVADVAMVTPLVDGMNLVAKEYIACQRDEPGVLVLSEFAGAAEELFDAMLVNPYDVQAIADALEGALAMAPDERRRRMESMRRRVMTFDARVWARTFLRDLQAPPATEDEPLGPPPVEPILQTLKAGKRVALFLDYDGTLREIERDPAAARPNPAVTALLDRLANRPGLDVTIISGRASEDLESFLGAYPFGLIAEHGAAVRPPHEKNWERLDRALSYEWKDELLKVLRLYEQSTPGSFVEVKRTGLVWHYRRADPEFGGWKARQLMEELSAVTANQPLQVRHGRKIVEITPASITKGAAIARILETTQSDLAVVAGDDETDETMFALGAPNLLSIKVGRGPTKAQYRLRTPAAMRAFLEEAIA